MKRETDGMTSEQLSVWKKARFEKIRLQRLKDRQEDMALAKSKGLRYQGGDGYFSKIGRKANNE